MPSSDIDRLLRCPACRAEVARDGAAYVCRAADCRRGYPIEDDIPRFLIDDARVLDPEDWSAVMQRHPLS